MLSCFTCCSHPAVASPAATTNYHVTISSHLELKKTKQAKQTGIRKIGFIYFHGKSLSEKAKIINAIGLFLKEQGEVLKAPKLSKADSNSLKIFYQEGLCIGTLASFIKEKFKLIPAEVNFNCCYVPPAMAVVTPAPSIKSELAKLDPSKPQLILKVILENPEIKYLILGEDYDMRAAHTFLQSNKAAFIANGYEVIASEFYSCTNQPAIDFQHFLKPGKDFGSHSLPNPRTPTVAKLEEAGLRLIALEDKNSSENNDMNEPPINRRQLFRDSAGTQIHREVVKRQEKGIPLSRNVGGKGKVIIWVGAAHVPGIAQYLTRAHTLSIGARDIPATSAEHCELNRDFEGLNVPLDVMFNIPEKASGAS